MAESSINSRIRDNLGDGGSVLAGIGEYFPWLLVAGLYVVAGIFLPQLFEVDTFTTVLMQSTAVTILAIGMAYTLIVAEIDLSIISILLFAPLVGVMAVESFGLPGITAIPITLGVGVLVGLANGLVITRIGVPALIQTLAVWWLLEGAVLSLTQGRTMATLPAIYDTIGSESTFGPIRNLIVLTVLVVAVMWYYSVKTVSGRRLFLVGGDPDAASRMGISASKYRVHAFVISGLLAAVGGIALIGRVGVIASGTGTDLLMPAIAAPVIAGVSLFGGTGKIINVPAGAILVQVILTITRVAGISGYEFQLVQGLLVFVAVVVMELRRGDSLLSGGA